MGAGAIVPAFFVGSWLGSDQLGLWGTNVPPTHPEALQRNDLWGKREKRMGRLINESGGKWYQGDTVSK